MSLHARILVGGLVGIVAGVIAFARFRDTPGLDAVIRYGTRPAG